MAHFLGLFAFSIISHRVESGLVQASTSSYWPQFVEPRSRRPASRHQWNKIGQEISCVALILVSSLS